MTKPQTTADDRLSAGQPKPWPGKCGHCGFSTGEIACPRCGLWGGITYKQTFITHKQTIPSPATGPLDDIALGYYGAMTNWCKLNGLEIRNIPEREGGGFAIRRDQGEAIIALLQLPDRNSP